MSAPASRRVLLAGATGLVGRELLRGLLADDTVAAVHALVRRPPGVQHPRLTVHTVDFAALPPLPTLDEAYLALGTTIKAAGSEAAFRAVDFDANLAAACAAQVAGARRIGLVSAMGADARSRIFYSRVKGELEEALAGLGFEGLVIARPSLLVGDRAALGQPERRGEKIGEQVGRWLKPLVPANYRPITAAQVAGALLRAVPTARGQQVLLSGQMQAS
ncbi:MAG TPA: NAD(P)H-binding protein [Ramlibacter sp.]|uniref:NAD(P)H-binding protein n=1 Tax=Ramlibacter sp. TaxID=1917967 RepID=UPI002D7E2742|nr:NAD(P)H-binding protein [Ramlibacter sp.]HET8747188.1 NAD(P)H-binding protein [Ramlibacter sp.]